MMRKDDMCADGNWSSSTSSGGLGTLAAHTSLWELGSELVWLSTQRLFTVAVQLHCWFTYFCSPGMLHPEGGHVCVNRYGDYPTDAKADNYPTNNPTAPFQGIDVESMACAGAVALRAGVCWRSVPRLFSLILRCTLRSSATFLTTTRCVYPLKQLMMCELPWNVVLRLGT